MKARYTATYTRAKYIGTHPHIAGRVGVYYWNSDQSSFIFRPDTDEDVGKVDWYRIHKENLQDLE